MKRYVIRWEIDIEADTPEEAAKEAWEHMHREGTTATYLEIFDKHFNHITAFNMENLEDENN